MIVTTNSVSSRSCSKMFSSCLCVRRVLMILSEIWMLHVMPSRAVKTIKVLCITEIDYCGPEPCEHGTCENAGTNYTCTCSDGYK